MIVNDFCDSLICITQRLEISRSKKLVRRLFRKCSKCQNFWPPTNIKCPCCKQVLKLTIYEKAQARTTKVYY
jgi:hypothetical protein